MKPVHVFWGFETEWFKLKVKVDNFLYVFAKQVSLIDIF